MTLTVRMSLAIVASIGMLTVAPAGQDQVFDPSKVVRPEEDPGADAADVEHNAWEWKFDPLHSGFPYTTTLTIENLCEDDQTVSIFVTDLADLTFDVVGCQLNVPAKACAKVVPPGTTEVKGEIKSDPFFYYVDPMAPHATPRPFKRVSGQVVVFHAKSGDCQPRREQYHVQYELGALQGAIPPPPPGPERTVGAGPCQVWWNTGKRPDMLEPQQRCEAEIRPLAVGYRERILPPHIQRAPGAWSWLPTSEQMTQMSSEELVAIKLRAERQIAG